MAETTIKEKCIRRLAGLKQMRQPYEADWKEIASLGQPSRSRFLASNTNKNQRQSNKRLHNGHGIKAFRTLQNGMTAGLSSDSRPWFTLRPADETLLDDPEVKAYFADVEKRMYAFLARTNFYEASKTTYLELALFGTAACVALEHAKYGMVFHPLTAGEFWIAPNSGNRVGALYRTCAMTSLQAMNMFKDKASQAVKNAYGASRYDEVFTFYHAIEENDELEEGKIGWRGMPWRSIYWQDGDDDKDRVAAEQGFETQPFWAPRWDTTGGDVWGQGPGNDALFDLRELQMQTKRKGEATDMHVWPEKVVAASVKLKNQPRNVVTVAASAVDLRTMVSVPYQVPYQTIEIVRQDIEEIKRTVSAAINADLFTAITDMAGSNDKTVPEIDARVEEKMTQLGPVISRVNTDMLAVGVDRVFDVMQRGRLLQPAPEAMRGNPNVEPEFISLLTQMQRMVGMGPIERVTGYVSQLAALYPEARHKLDVNELIDEYADRAGAPPKIVISTKDASEAADAEAQAAQNEKLAAAGVAAAPAVKDLTDAAALAAQAPAGGQTATDALLPAL